MCKCSCVQECEGTTSYEDKMERLGTRRTWFISCYSSTVRKRKLILFPAILFWEIGEVSSLSICPDLSCFFSHSNPQIAPAASSVETPSGTTTWTVSRTGLEEEKHLPAASRALSKTDATAVNKVGDLWHYFLYSLTQALLRVWSIVLKVLHKLSWYYFLQNLHANLTRVNRLFHIVFILNVGSVS